MYHHISKLIFDAEMKTAYNEPGEQEVSGISQNELYNLEKTIFDMASEMKYSHMFLSFL